MRREASLFCTDMTLRKTVESLAFLCGAEGLAVADGDDPAMAEEALSAALECPMPLIWITRHPETVSLPEGICARVLGRPFLFADFREAVASFSDTPVAPRTEDDASALHWDSVSRSVRVGGVQITLTPREADLFARLYAAAPAPLPREQLQGDFLRRSGNGTEVYISYLRRKLESLPGGITVAFIRGQGYALLIRGK